MPLSTEQREELERLHTAVVCDVTDEMGLMDNVLSLDIRPVSTKQPVVGTAFTMQRVDIGYTIESFQEHAKVTHEALKEISDGDFVVMGVPQEIRAGAWGELLSTTARAGGAVGAVTDGYTRDAPQIMDMEFPVWARGHSPLDAQGRCRVSDYEVPIHVGGLTVEPGDVIMADYMGIIRFPPDIVDDVIDRATERYDDEGSIREELESGRSRDKILDELEFL